MHQTAIGRPDGRHTWATIIAGALLLLWPAALNGYPLVYADTGNYLGQALQHYVGWNAPPFYSIFLLATDLRVTLWLPILVQSLLVVHLLSVVLRQFGWRGPWPVLASCVGLAAVTTLPWFLSFVTPYVFGGVVVLALWLLAFGEVGTWERRYLMLLAVGAVAVHFSHVMLGFGLAVVGGGGATFYWGSRAGLRAFGRMAMAPLVVCVMLVGVNLAANGKASVAPFGSVLVAARMIFDGTGRDYLRAACPTQHYRICPYLDQIGDDRDDFLFNRPLLAETLGGAKAWAPEARAIVYGTLAYEPGAVLRAALANTFTLFDHLWLREALRPWPDSPGPETMIRRYFPPAELAAFRDSAQTRGVLQDEAATTAPLQVALTWLGIAGLIVLLWTERRRPPGWTLSLVVLAALAGNALITGGLSGIEDHYEARLAWLPVLVPALVLAGRVLPARTRPGGQELTRRTAATPTG